MANLEALKTLMRMQSPSNMTSTGDPYLDKRRTQIISGEDELAPSELEQRLIQEQHGGGFSRDMIRDSGIQMLKQKLGLMNADAQAKLAPVRLKGEYAVRAAQERGRAQRENTEFVQGQQTERAEANQKAIMDRLEKTLGSKSALQEDQQQFKSSKVPTAALGLIQRERAAVEKKPQGFFNRLRGKNPDLESFDNAQQYAQQIFQDYPDADAAEALAAMGQSPSPQELATISRLLMLYRGN